MSGRRQGVKVRGLRVLRTSEAGRASLWSFVPVLFGDAPDADQWHVVTVYDGPRSQVAMRRFKHLPDAEQARQRFVDVVRSMDQDSYRVADWQLVLDGV